uniref:hypothetical protein n=1 Tax=Streptomyces rhizosphaericus TaxID=114699 RepID=UPI00202E2A14|nr:hypothetical protein [Streptomyces rhizosphaericus]
MERPPLLPHQHSDGPKVEIRTSDDDDNLTEAGAGLDLWRGKNYLRPKWGIYRSLNSSGLQTTYLLTRNFKAYKLQ